MRVWGIASNEEEQTVTSYVEQPGLSYPILLDEDGSVNQAYQQAGAFPTAAYPQDWIVNGEGVIVYVSNAFDLAAMEAVLGEALE